MLSLTCKPKDNINFLTEINIRGEIKKCSTERVLSIKDRRELTQTYLYLRDKEENINYIDFHDLLCPDYYCNLIDEKNNLIYQDSRGHFNKANAYYLRKNWSEILKEFIVD